MHMELSAKQVERQQQFRRFVEENVAPDAERFDREETLPSALVKKIAAQGYLGSILPVEHGGIGLDPLTYGVLHEEIGRVCSSTRSLLTVHDMVATMVLRWGSRHLRERFVPQLAKGELIGAFALTEPDVGSDAKSVQTQAELCGEEYVVTGKKKWITFGQIADVFLVFTTCGGKCTALLVERSTPGIEVRPIRGLLGLRASLLAEIEFVRCRVPADHLIGTVGTGFTHVAVSALDLGRYSVAWGCLGLAEACLQASVAYTQRRKQFGVFLREHQLVKEMIAEMTTNIHAARLLCIQAAHLKQAASPKTLLETSIAKYFTSRIAMRAAADAVQLHGANGCSSDFPVQRFFRDAKIMEIIEGSTQLQQLIISHYGYEYSSAQAPRLASPALTA